ncbi:MAG: hypothetical protein JNL53_20170 [Cyclobacteriaceae bacterium]|nr:hypothetical protein [Cyclobacteriaceae bacterium]
MRNFFILVLLQGLIFHQASAQGTFSGQNRNYRVKNKILVPITSEAALTTLTKFQSAQVVEYLDDQGKPIQAINVQGSPLGKDVVDIKVFDNLGRETMQYLPMVSTATDGRYKPDLLLGPTLTYNQSLHYNFYTGGAAAFLPTDQQPYSVTYFDNTPLNRVVEQGGVGAAWQQNLSNPLQSKTTEFTYGANVGTEVRKWTLVPNGTTSFNLTSAYYAAGILSKATTIDLNNQSTIVFKDSEGKTVLTKSQDGSTWLETHYVYDSHNNLVFILPPALIKAMSDAALTSLDNIPAGQQLLAQSTSLSGPYSTPYRYAQGSTITLANTFVGSPGFELRPFNGSLLLAQYAYQYAYDTENRKIAEKGPGKEWSFFVYDKLDRLALSQDGNQRLLNQWTFTKYDQWSRPVLTGVTTLPGTVDQIRLDLLTDPDVFETTGTIVHGYTNNCYPSVSDPNAYLVISFYDDYCFKSQMPATLTFYAGATCQSIMSGTMPPSYGAIDYYQGELSGMPPVEFKRVRGLPTATKVKVLGQSKFLWNVVYYDDQQRVIQSTGENHLGGADRVSSKYNFAGWTLATRTSHNSAGSSVSVLEEFEYDHAGRMVKAWHQVGSQPKIVLSALQYNELGQAVKKNLHSVDNGSAYLQYGDFRFNIKGWMTNTWHARPDGFGYFGMELAYNAIAFDANTQERYDGLLAGVRWYPDNTSKLPYYNFQYDNRGQLTSATFKKLGDPTVTGLYNEDNLTYDLNGNIKTLNRSGGSFPVQTIDQLDYNYGTGGNQLMKVTDTPANALGFNDQNTTNNDYEYDANGNLIKDKNKNIIAITYNLLNRMDRVTFSNLSYIQYTYDAAGVKLNQTYFNSANQPLSETDYVGEFIYLDDQLQMATHAEGRVLPAVNANMLNNASAGTTTGFNGFRATVTTEMIGPDDFVKVVSTATVVPPLLTNLCGLRGIGNNVSAVFNVNPGETYRLRVLGYQTVGSNAKLFMTPDYSTSLTISKVGPALPIGAGNMAWVEMFFTVPAGYSSLSVGVAWDGATIGDTFYINHVSLYKSDWEYQYFLTDQVGSVRAVLQTNPGSTIYKATMETTNLTYENTIFNNSIASSQIRTNAAANTTVGGDKVFEVNNNYRIGPRKSLRVYTGDNIAMQASALYISNAGFSKAPASVMISAVAGAMAGGATSVIDGITTAYNNSVNNLANFGLSPTQNPTKPAAYLNFILFDDYYRPVKAQSVPVGNSPNVTQLLALNTGVINEPGYLFVYLSYDDQNAQVVFYDELTITHSESHLIQSTSYYPYGLPAYSWVREGETANKYFYQGKEVDANVGWQDFGSRMYWADLGRWFAADPQNQFSSPYLAMGNNPMMGVDPDGEFVHLIVGALIGGYSGYRAGKSMGLKGWDLFGMTFIGAGSGALLANATAGLAASTNSGFVNALASSAFESGFRSVASGTDPGQNIIRGAISTGLGYGFSELGLAIGSKLGSDNVASVGDGLINLGFEAFATTANSITTNFATGQRWDSRLDIGIGDFSLHFRNGKLSKNIIDNLDNLTSLYAYTRGFIDVAQGYSYLGFDNFTFSPQFIRSYKSAMIDDPVGPPEERGPIPYHGYTAENLIRNNNGRLNKHGAQLYGYTKKGKLIFDLHESLHSIDRRLKGNLNDDFYYHILYGNKQNHHDSYYEKRIIKWAGF